MKQKEIFDFGERKIFTVQEINRYIRRILERDEELNRVWVRGEVSNFREVSGNRYFTLKDEFSQLRCVMFRGLLGFDLKDGMKIIARGNIGVYEKRGEYQLYVEEMQPDGIGALHLAFEQLKERLRDEGLFDEAHKRPISKLPKRIGIITSPTGAAIRDILKIIRQRFPRDIIISPVLVQGDSASGEIAHAIELMNAYSHSKERIDVLIVGRGGGSLEELWAFNEEIVARAIFNSEIPVISAVGHETDFTIADFVADKRAPTPSAAAEMVVPDKMELFRQLDSLVKRMEQRMRTLQESSRKRLRNIEESIVFRKPMEGISQGKQQVDEFVRELHTSILHYVGIKQEQLHALAGMLEALSPLQILERGYSISFKLPDEKIIRRTDDVDVGDRLKVLVSDGEIFCDVDGKKYIKANRSIGGHDE
jgi:exodeoxyribonuclease VII large subunit